MLAVFSCRKDSQVTLFSYEKNCQEKIPRGCKIIIDASHDGGVWWYPQYEDTGFDPNSAHQGQAFANILREKGFEVDELGRSAELTEEMFSGYYIVIRAGGFEPYSANEINVYTQLLCQGMNMVFMTDHKCYVQGDAVENLLGLEFSAVASGSITKLKTHLITENMSSLDYGAGSVLINAARNPDIEVLGWLGEDDYADMNCNGVKDNNEPSAPPVMGILNYPKGHIFFIGDVNGLEFMPQPFIDNLIEWMGSCSL